jgi:hypothetical protein
MSVILATQEAEIGGSRFEASLDKKFMRSYHERPFTKNRLVEWLTVKALSSSPSSTHTHKNPITPMLGSFCH